MCAASSQMPISFHAMPYTAAHYVHSTPSLLFANPFRNLGCTFSPSFRGRCLLELDYPFMLEPQD
ncbi:hypothetical protein WG66_014870 [Moniliophthora roreri]|nr:hypothetical protein WG66_014870 [Moniliophthora roreri]